MTKYIELEDALAIIEEKQKELCPVGRYGRSYVYGSNREKYDAWDEIIDALENVSNADVSSVVRCKNYKYWQDNNDGYPHEECRWGHGETPDANDFCSYGMTKRCVDDGNC